MYKVLSVAAATLLSVILPAFAEPIGAVRTSVSRKATFSPSIVEAEAEAIARQPYEQPTYAPPAPLGEFGYDEYRDIRFKDDRSIWLAQAGARPTFSLQFFLASFIHRDRAQIELVEGGHSRPLTASREMFDFGPSESRVPLIGDFAFSGFRVHGPLNDNSGTNEILAFNGASYFRALGRAHTYGLSARGLSLNTIGPIPEEFPRFTKFWLEKPIDTLRFKIHALLDSPSVAGAYHFTVTPGAPTVIDVTLRLFPRRKIGNVGVAPLTSMFLFDSRNHSRFQDFRAAVHDSDGLAVAYRTGERIWRPLLNPQALQTSRFSGSPISGFGLVQRKRKYEDFFDLEAHYHQRPSVWTEPIGDWGSGSVELLELPIGAEWGDNIVAYWRPTEPLVPWNSYSYAYRSLWNDEVPTPARRVTQTRKGIEGGELIFAIDYEASTNNGKGEPKIIASAGKVSQPILQTDPSTGVLRCFFKFYPDGAKVADLRVVMLDANDVLDKSTEVWTYRWVAEQ